MIFIFISSWIWMKNSDVFPYGIYMLTYEHVTRQLGNLQIFREKRTQINNSQFEMIVTVTAGALAGKFFQYSLRSLRVTLA